MLTHTNVSLMMMMMMIVAVVVVMIMMMIISLMVMITMMMMMMMMMLTGFWNVGLEQTRSISGWPTPHPEQPLFFVCPSCTALQPVYLSALGFSRSGSAKCLFTVALSAHSV